MPIRTFEEVKNAWSIFSQAERKFHLFLLYSQSENNISKFIRENFYESDRISGHNCFIFLIEQPPKDWNDVAAEREYWQKFNFTKDIAPCFTEITPYEQSAVFDIAKHFGLNYRQVPCVVMFTNINEQAVYVYKLKNDWSQDKLSLEFRRMFDILSKYPLQDAIIDLTFFDYLNKSESFLRKALASPISIILGNLIGKYAPAGK